MGKTRRARLAAPWLLLAWVAAAAWAESPSAPPPPQAAPEPTGDALLRDGKKLYSQHDEELIIRHFFHDRRDGFYVDVGAWHWRKFSTTYYLDEHLGWHGIAIDALPWLEKDYVAHRPRARFFNYIVTDHSGGKERFFAAGPVSSTDPEWSKQFQGVQDKVEIEVETITLNDLLAREGVKKIDFLSMDIEGGEFKALDGFDIARYRPELVCIEAARPEKRERTRAWFEAHGYRLLEEYLPYDRVNVYFAPRSKPEGGPAT